MNEIDSLRGQIRAIDSRLLELVRERNDAAKRIGQLKRQLQQPLQNFEVEKAVLDHALETAARLGVHEETARGLVRALIEAALRVQERDEARRPPPAHRSALVVGGSGLMGTWWCRFLTEEGYRVFVDDPRPSPTHPAGKPGEHGYDLIVLATPPGAIPEVLDAVGPTLSTKTLLVDIGSVKGAAAAKLHALARAGKKVASLHPMFGPNTDVLMGKNVLVLDAGNPQARAEAKRLFAPTTAQILELPLDEHDAHMAEILGLSHATSIAFNAALAGGPFAFSRLERMASTTFRKQVDVAREVAQESPRLYYEIQALNPGTDAVLARLERAVRDLRAAIAARDQPGFTALMELGRRYYGGP